jgi:hypothetical protein
MIPLWLKYAARDLACIALLCAPAIAASIFFILVFE